MKQAVAVLALVLTGLTVPADAATESRQGTTGNWLLEVCTEKKEGSVKAIGDALSCVWYLRGVADTLDVWVKADQENARACIPGGVTNIQMRDVVLDFLQKNPKDRHRSGAEVVTFALVEAWPCRRTNPLLTKPEPR
jgi:hypothetical protein